MSAGSTNTSLWTHYNAGEREYCGNKFPDGMRKNDMLEQQVITPTTKAATHDVPISAQDIVKQGIVSQQDWDQVNHKLVICHVTFQHADPGTTTTLAAPAWCLYVLCWTRMSHWQQPAWCVYLRKCQFVQ